MKPDLISSEQRVPYGKILIALIVIVVAGCAFGIWMSVDP